jgi:hypothetical protein
MITLVSYFNKNADFIEIQYKSILKHVKGDYVYIIFNTSTSHQDSSEITNKCKEFNITEIKLDISNIISDEGLRSVSDIASRSIGEGFKYLSKRTILKIDSDMFFISDINLVDMFKNNDLIYIPRNYREQGLNCERAWIGIFGINLNKVSTNIIDGDSLFKGCMCDVSLSKKRMELFSLDDINGDKINDKINACYESDQMLFNIITNRIINDENSIYYKDNDFYNKFKTKSKQIKNICLDYSFPHPFFIDIVSIDDCGFIIHFGSASWKNFPTDYFIQKKKSFFEFFNIKQ